MTREKVMGVERLRKEYQRLKEQMHGLDVVCSGTIIERVIKAAHAQKGSRSRKYGPYYQWTRKLAGKTVTVNLAADQARAYQRAIREDRKLRQTLDRMRQISLRILDTTTVGVPRRNRTPTKKTE